MYYIFLQRNADSEKMNGKYFVGDPLTHWCNQSNGAFECGRIYEFPTRK